ncbi:hypothetical protein ACPSKX_11710 [Moritella viscosa]
MIYVAHSEMIALRYRDAIATAAFNLFSEDISSLTYVEQIAYFHDALHNKFEQQQALNNEQAQLIITLTEKVKLGLTETDTLTNNAAITDLDIISKTATE